MDFSCVIGLTDLVILVEKISAFLLHVQIMEPFFSWGGLDKLTYHNVPPHAHAYCPYQKLILQEKMMYFQ